MSAYTWPTLGEAIDGLVAMTKAQVAAIDEYLGDITVDATALIGHDVVSLLHDVTGSTVLLHDDLTPIEALIALLTELRTHWIDSGSEGPSLTMLAIEEAAT